MDPKGMTRTLFQFIHSAFVRIPSTRSPQELEYLERFVGPCQESDPSKIPVIWFNSVKPFHANRFLLHILLTMGEYENEPQLIGDGHLLNAFKRSGLVPLDGHPLTEAVITITRRYILEQLYFLPGGSQMMNRCTVAAHGCLYQAIVNNALALFELPPALYTKLQVQLDEKIIKHINESRETIITQVVNDLHKVGITGMPSIQQLCDPASLRIQDVWNADNLTQGRNQPLESFIEQRRVWDFGKEKLDEYCQASHQIQTRNLIVAGGPGNGKTTSILVLLIMAASRGLSIAGTALMSERSHEVFGLDHIAQMFCIPVNEMATPNRLAELAIGRLMRQPRKVAFIRQIDVLAFDEYGLLAATLLAVLDKICRKIRGSQAFMGGILVNASVDCLQPGPINDKPILLSSHTMSCFDLELLHHSVRCSGDANLREIQAISRMPYHQLKDDPSHIERFKVLIQQCCRHFAIDDMVGPEVLRVFGKKKAAHEIQAKRFVALRRRFHGSDLVSRRAEDEESTPNGMWVQATTTSSHALDRKVKEPTVLYFFPGAVYEITFNRQTGTGTRLSQTQLAVLLQQNMPTQAQVDAFRDVVLWVAPHGLKEMPVSNVTTATLTANGWKEAFVGCSPENIQFVYRGITAKRRQYGLKHRIASTIHSVMGQTLLSMVSQVTMEKDNPVFALWMRSQLVVLLSRTNYAKDMYFIGEAKKTSEALAAVLLKRSQYDEYQAHIIEVLSCRRSAPQPHGAPPIVVAPPIINAPEFYPFRMCDLELPTDNSGFVYLLISLQDRTTTYIGKTTGLAKRLSSHNSAYGKTKQTSANPLLKPWAYYGVVCGFQGNDSEMKRIESRWGFARDARRDQVGAGNLLPQEVFDIGAGLLTEQGNHQYRIIQCCKR